MWHCLGNSHAPFCDLFLVFLDPAILVVKVQGEMFKQYGMSAEEAEK